MLCCYCYCHRPFRSLLDQCAKQNFHRVSSQFRSLVGTVSRYAEHIRLEKKKVMRRLNCLWTKSRRGRPAGLPSSEGTDPKRTDRKKCTGANECTQGGRRNYGWSFHFSAASTNSSTSSVLESFLCTGRPAFSLADGFRPEKSLLDSFWVSLSFRSKRSWEGVFVLALCAGVISSSPKSINELSLPCVCSFCRLGECGGMSNWCETFCPFTIGAMDMICWAASSGLCGSLRTACQLRCWVGIFSKPTYTCALIIQSRSSSPSSGPPGPPFTGRNSLGRHSTPSSARLAASSR